MTAYLQGFLGTLLECSLSRIQVKEKYRHHDDKRPAFTAFQTATNITKQVWQTQTCLIFTQLIDNL